MKHFILITALFLSIFASALAQVQTTDTLSTTVSAYADGQIIRGKTGHKFLFVTEIPRNTKNVIATKGKITWLTLRMDSVSTAKIELYAMKDTSGLDSTVGVNHDTLQFTKAFTKNLIGSTSITPVAQGTWAKGAREVFGEVSWNRDYTIDAGAGDRIFWILVARGAFTPKAGGAITITARMEAKE